MDEEINNTNEEGGGQKKENLEAERQLRHGLHPECRKLSSGSGGTERQNTWLHRNTYGGASEREIRKILINRIIYAVTRFLVLYRPMDQRGARQTSGN